MPQIATREIAIALDMRGCPNRCRHCWLGCGANGRMGEDDLRWAAEQFRGYVKDGETEPFIRKLSVSSWYREPDHSDDYRRLRELECELSDGDPQRFELLSIHRLARDPDYAHWAKEVGPDTCQISFFGMRETTDWFYRRRGAFQDCITATERLLAVGMKPRWQVFVTKKLFPDAEALLALSHDLRLRERVAELGGEFVLFAHPPDLVGEGMAIVDLEATLEEARSLPTEMQESTRRYFGRERIWTTEAESFVYVTEGFDGVIYPVPSIQAFCIARNWEVYSNQGSQAPWWSLGNLKTDPVATLFRRYEENEILGLRANYNVAPAEIAKRYGNSQGTGIAKGAEHWLELYCRDKWAAEQR